MRIACLSPCILSLLVVAISCAGPASGGAQPSWRRSLPADTPLAKRRQPSASVELGASDAQIVFYNGASPSAMASTPVSRGMIRILREASASAGVVAPVEDSRLSRALAELAAVAPVRSPIRYSLIEFALQRNGIIEPSPHLVIIEGRLDDLDSIFQQIREIAATLVRSGKYQRVGVGSARRDGFDMVLLALQESKLTTKPIARELPTGGSTALEGTLARGFKDPHVFHTDEGGRVSKMSVARLGGSGFRALFACGAHRGRQQIEITAADAGGSTVLANFPIWCGTRSPRSLRVDTGVSEPAVKTSDEAEGRMALLVNQGRAKQGLPALFLDPRVSAIARRYSEEMLRTGNIAHLSPTSGSASDRVAAGGVHSSVILENVARAYGVAEAQDGLMNSPGHRANLLSADVNRFGLGIALGREVAGRRELFVTQLFVYSPEPIDPAAVYDKVQAKIAASKVMYVSAALREIAQSIANNLARGVSSSDATRMASKRLDGLSGEFTRVSTLITAVTKMSSFDPSASLGGAELQYQGIGVAQGSHPVLGAGAIFIVVLLGAK